MSELPGGKWFPDNPEAHHLSLSPAPPLGSARATCSKGSATEVVSSNLNLIATRALRQRLTTLHPRLQTWRMSWNDYPT